MEVVFDSFNDTRVFLIYYASFLEIPVVQMMATEEDDDGYPEEDPDSPATGGK